MKNKYSIESICDLLIYEICVKRNTPLSYAKLCHYIYYTEVEYMIKNNSPMFEDKFEAWVFCPVNIKVHQKINPENIYGEINSSKISKEFDYSKFSKSIKSLISDIVDYYSNYTLDQFITIMRREYPYISARDGYESSERCNKEINKEISRVYYRGMNKLMKKCLSMEREVSV